MFGSATAACYSRELTDTIYHGIMNDAKAHFDRQMRAFAAPDDVSRPRLGRIASRDGFPTTDTSHERHN